MASKSIRRLSMWGVLGCGLTLCACSANREPQSTLSGTVISKGGAGTASASQVGSGNVNTGTPTQTVVNGTDAGAVTSVDAAVPMGGDAPGDVGSGTGGQGPDMQGYAGGGGMVGTGDDDAAGAGGTDGTGGAGNGGAGGRRSAGTGGMRGSGGRTDD